MDASTAERWVTISALVVAGVYAYRRLTETASSPATFKKLVGIGSLPQLGAFATAWGFTFLTVAIMAEAAPGLGGGFAILIATGDLLTNSSSVLSDVTSLEGKAVTQQTTAAGKGAAQGAASATAGVAHAGAGAAGKVTG